MNEKMNFKQCCICGSIFDDLKHVWFEIKGQEFIKVNKNSWDDEYIKPMTFCSITCFHPYWKRVGKLWENRIQE